MISELFKAKENQPLFDTTPMASPFKTVEYQLSTIVEKIKDIDNLNEEEIKQIIIRQYPTILNYDLFLSVPETRNAALELFTNKRFLVLFFDVVGLLDLSESQKICINKLVYDYYSLPEKDNEICELLLSISYVTNNRLVIRLSAILGVNGARILSMVANSSFRIDKKVHRINTFIIRCGIKLSVQNVVDIYLTIFDRFKDLFINSMLESIEHLSIEDQSNDIIRSNFNTISTALYTILDSMVSKDVEQILLNYVYALQILPSDVKIRFSFKNIINMSDRMKKIRDNVEYETGLIIP